MKICKKLFAIGLAFAMSFSQFTMPLMADEEEPILEETFVEEDKLDEDVIEEVTIEEDVVEEVTEEPVIENLSMVGNFGDVFATRATVTKTINGLTYDQIQTLMSQTITLKPSDSSKPTVTLKLSDASVSGSDTSYVFTWVIDDQIYDGNYSITETNTSFEDYDFTSTPATVDVVTDKFVASISGITQNCSGEGDNEIGRYYNVGNVSLIVFQKAPGSHGHVVFTPFGTVIDATFREKIASLIKSTNGFSPVDINKIDFIQFGPDGTISTTDRGVVAYINGILSFQYPKEWSKFFVGTYEEISGTPISITDTYTPPTPYTATGSVDLTAFKQLNDGATDMEDGDYSFELSETNSKFENGVVIDSAYNMAQRINSTKITDRVDFTTIVFDENDIGKHYYTISEVIPDVVEGMTFDTHVVQVVVDVTDNGDGTLDSAVTYDGNENAYIFKNKKDERILPTTTVQFIVNKTENGMDPTSAYSFSIYEANEDGTYRDDALLETIMNENAEGLVTPTATFSEITYTEDDINKTFYYRIVEDIPLDASDNYLNGMTYDDSVYTARVNIIDEESSIRAEVSYYKDEEESNSILFENNYEANGAVSIPVSKVIEGMDWDSHSFDFNLMSDGEIVNTYTIDDSISADRSGSKSFTYDIAYKTNTDLTAIDAYIADEKVQSISLQDDQAVFTYTVLESIPDDTKGITYDTNAYTVEVTVDASKKDGTLDVKPVITLNGDSCDTIKFVNTYQASGSVTLNGTKELVGKDLEAEVYSFVVSSEKEIETVKNGVASNNIAPIQFSEISFAYNEDHSKMTATYLSTVDEADVINDEATFNYTVKEVIPMIKEKGMIYDETVYDVVVKVVDNKEGKLIPTVTYNREDSMAFVNEYKPGSTADVLFNGKKKVDGKEWADISKEVKDQLVGKTEFTLSVYNETSKEYEVVCISTLEADGTFVLGAPISYTLEYGETKSYTYRVQETKTVDAYNLDSKVHEYKVKVVDQKDGTAIVTVNGVDGPSLTITTTFNNTSKNKGKNHTGIGFNSNTYFAMLFASLSVVLFLMERKVKNMMK